MFLSFFDSFTSQVITSSDLLPPPPLTLAGVTSGTVQETKEQVMSGGKGQEGQQGCLAEVTQFKQILGCTQLCLLRSEIVWLRVPKHQLAEVKHTRETAISYLFPIQQEAHLLSDTTEQWFSSTPRGQSSGGWGKDWGSGSKAWVGIYEPRGGTQRSDDTHSARAELRI